MPAAEDKLKRSLTALRNASRFSGNKNSYRKDNPSEYERVIAYLDGGGYPQDVSTQMGIHAVLQEEARRELVVPPLPPNVARSAPTGAVAS